MKLLKRTLSLFLSILFILSATTLASATVPQVNKSEDDSQILGGPASELGVSRVTVNNLIFHRVQPGTQGHTPWGQLNTGDTVTMTRTDWGRQIWFNNHWFVRVTVSASPSQNGAHNGRTGWLAVSFISTPVWTWVS
jgi:hypothetical protein